MDDTPRPAHKPAEANDDKDRRPANADDAPPDGEDDFAAPPETEQAKKRRLAWEAKMIAEARASAAAGHVVASEEVDAWIDILDTDHELPPPRSRR